MNFDFRRKDSIFSLNELKNIFDLDLKQENKSY